MAGDHVQMNLCSLHLGKNDMSVHALETALLQIESGLVNRNISIRSVRMGELRIQSTVTHRDVSLTAFCAGLAPLYISHLILSRNRIRCSGMLQLSKALRRMTHLQILDVSSNNLSYLGWNALAEVLVASKHLRELVVSGNHIRHSSTKTDAAASPQSPEQDSSVQLTLQNHAAESIGPLFGPICHVIVLVLTFAAARCRHVCF